MQNTMLLILGSAGCGALISTCINAATTLWIKRQEFNRERVNQALKLLEIAASDMKSIRKKDDGTLSPNDHDYNNPSSLLSDMIEKIIQAEKQ